MTKSKLQTESNDSQQNLESIVLETRKVKALEKIANSMDALTIWFEEINKNEWSERMQYYLYEFYNMAKEINSNNSQSNELQTDTNTTGDISELPPRKIRPKKDIQKV